MNELIAFALTQLAKDERELKKDPPVGLGYANLPARMAREVAVKRAILAEHSPCYPTTYPQPSGQPTCSVCAGGGFDREPVDWPCLTVRASVAVWSDAPEYRSEWKP